MPPIVDAQHDAPPATGRDDSMHGCGEPLAAAQVPGAGRPRIALAHDWLCGMRGGEQVLERLARAAAEIGEVSALYVMFDNGLPHAPAIDALSKRRSRLGGWPGALRARRWLLPLYPMAVADLSRQLARDHERAPIDLLISSSSAAVKGLRAPPGAAHICYCHSPARYIWSRGADYRGRGVAGRARGLGLALARPLWRMWDRRTARHVTTFVANSRHIAAEIERCYRRPAQVIHPPIRDAFLAPQEPRAQARGESAETRSADKTGGASSQPNPAPRSGDGPAVAAAAPELGPGTPLRRERLWLVVSALEPYKRVDLAIEAARLAGVHLVIAGDGSCRRELERSAGPLVRFEGRISDDRLRELYHTAAVLLFPQIEDFGIVCAEAQACGLPVAAAGAGGALDIILDGQTGAFAAPGDARALAEAARRAAGISPDACRANAARFSAGRFDAQVRKVIGEALAATAPR